MMIDENEKKLVGRRREEETSCEESRTRTVTCQGSDLPSLHLRSGPATGKAYLSVSLYFH